MKKYIYTTHIFNFKATTLNETQPNDFMKYYYLKFSLNILFDNIIWRSAYLVDRQKCNCSRMKLWIFLADNSSKCTHKIAAIIFSHHNNNNSRCTLLCRYPKTSSSPQGFSVDEQRRTILGLLCWPFRLCKST